MKRFIPLHVLIISIIPFFALSQSCLPDGIRFTTQEEIDNFRINHPNCTEIEGDVEITLSSISNLDSLYVIASIGGNLELNKNSSLTSISGLSNLTTVEGRINLWENNLTDLTGLNSLETIGKGLAITNMASLTSLSGLDNLTSIGSGLQITMNFELESLSGLENLISVGESSLIIRENTKLIDITGIENIEAGTIDLLQIKYNSVLAECDVQSVCDYLAAPNGTVDINDNAAGCASQTEVEEACGTSVNEMFVANKVDTQPNPFYSITNLTYTLKQPSTVLLSIFNQLGQLVYQQSEEQQQGEQQLQWDASKQTEGLYFYRLEVGDAIANGKIVKVK